MDNEFKSLSVEKCLIYGVYAVCDENGELITKENFCSNLDVAISMQRELFCLGYYEVSIKCVDCYTKF